MFFSYLFSFRINLIQEKYPIYILTKNGNASDNNMVDHHRKINPFPCNGRKLKTKLEHDGNKMCTRVIFFLLRKKQNGQKEKKK